MSKLAAAGIRRTVAGPSPAAAARAARPGAGAGGPGAAPARPPPRSGGGPRASERVRAFDRLVEGLGPLGPLQTRVPEATFEARPALADEHSCGRPLGADGSYRP